MSRRNNCSINKICNRGREKEEEIRYMHADGSAVTFLCMGAIPFLCRSMSLRINQATGMSIVVVSEVSPWPAVKLR